MAKLEEITEFLDSTLRVSDFRDRSLNGLQIEADNREIRTVALAVDAGEAIFCDATRLGADLLLVHHGLFWGDVVPVTGALSRKIKILLDANCSLYACHLPLDSHMVLGNAAGLAEHLSLEEVLPFCEVDGNSLGCSGVLHKPHTLDDICQTLHVLKNYGPEFIFPFGEKREIRSVAVVTGSGGFAAQLCKANDIDLLISGEPKHEIYHLCHELRQHAIFIGHYSSEVFGVQRVGEDLKRAYELSTIFIDHPTGI